MTRAKALRGLREQYRQSLQTRASAASALALVDDLFHWPVVSIPAVAKKTGMTYNAVQNNVEKLVELGILVEMTGNQRNRLYLAKDIVKVIS